MTQILNTLTHRIYRDDKPVPVGGTYDGTADPDNGQIKAGSDEGKAWLAAHGAGATADELDSTDEPTSAVLAATVGANAAGGFLATAGVRNPHADPDDVLDDAAAIAEHVAENPDSPVGAVEIDPKTGAIVEDVQTPDLSVPATVDESRTDVPGGGGTITTASEGMPTDAPDVVEVGAGTPEYADGVKFASGSAENKADTLVAEGKLTPAKLKAGEGTGADGKFKASDLDELSD